MHNCAYTVDSMADDGEWDPRKAAANLKKHGVDFADAATVLHDEQAITIRADEGIEERYVTIGTDALGNVLVVVYTWRGKNIGLFPCVPPNSWLDGSCKSEHSGN